MYMQIATLLQVEQYSNTKDVKLSTDGSNEESGDRDVSDGNIPEQQSNETDYNSSSDDSDDSMPKIDVYAELFPDLKEYAVST